MDISRRTVLQGAASATTAALIAGGAALAGRAVQARPAQALRPPGAIADERFLGACIRCGLCVRDCPPGNLKLSQWGDGLARDVAIGTPFFEARDIPCEMCEDIPCVKACPTGALDPALTDITKAKMGVAVLIDQENCLNFLGLRCDVCYRVCPLLDKAITLEPQHNARTGKHTLFIPVVHSDQCTGCGKCEKGCVLEQAAIKVLPVRLAKGAPGKHYRLGWEEKEKAGGPLIKDTIQLPARRPESSQ
jgi:ferredoxin-type protein NapG